MIAMIVRALRSTIVALACALLCAADNPVAANDAAMRAAEEKRYCDAAFIFLQLYSKTRDDLALYRAAEVARAADDRQLALRLYRLLLENHPDAEKKDQTEKKVVDLKALMQQSGAGTACVQPPKACGDWIVAPGEACDDGNLVDGDGCDASCVPTGCGNGTRSIGEICDDGNLQDGDGCDSNCTKSTCGNGVRAADEACDDGNTEDGDTCSSECALPPPESTQRSALPVLVTASSAFVVVGGLVSAGIGAVPIVAHEDALQDVNAAEQQIDEDPGGALASARIAQVRQRQATTDWNTWGQPLVVTGAIAVGVGVVGAAIGSWLLLTEDP